MFVLVIGLHLAQKFLVPQALGEVPPQLVALHQGQDARKRARCLVPYVSQDAPVEKPNEFVSGPWNQKVLGPPLSGRSTAEQVVHKHAAGGATRTATYRIASSITEQ